MRKWINSVAGRWAALPTAAKLIVAILVVQAAFWLAVKPWVIGSASPNFESFETSEYAHASMPSPDYAAVANAQFENLESLPGEHCCKAGYRAFRYQVEIADVPESGIGIAPHVRADNFTLHVNGKYVGGTGKMELADITYDALFRQIYHVPASGLVKGQNEVTFVMVRDGIPYFDYFPPIVADYAEMKTQLAHNDFMVGPYLYIVFAAMLIVTVFALIFAIISRGEKGLYWLFLLAGGMTLLSHYYIWANPPFSGQGRIAYFFILGLFVPYAWFGWADGWSREKMVWPIRLATLAFAIGTAAILYSLYALPYGPGYDGASEIYFYGGIAFTIVTALRLLWNFRDLQEDRYWEAAIALLLIFLMAVHAITELTQALNMGYVNRTQPFLILGIAMAFFARKVRLFRSSAQISSLLQTQLDERTSELAIAHTREKQLVRKHALDEERERIMRDMHDGLGSHLMSMLMMAKKGKANHGEYAEGLQLVIDEMRLMIDSMDSVGESLRAALTIFKKRVIPRTKEADFDVSWINDADDILPDYSPRAVLQIFRILQEAITNALKHSGGDKIAIHIRPAQADPKNVEISVADNGSGIADPRRVGRGLKNMLVRAEAIGADFNIDSSDTGVELLLTLSGNQQ